MKIEILLLVAIVSISVSLSYAAKEDLTFEVRQIPEKIIVGSQGEIYLSAKQGNTTPVIIKELTATSLDSSIVSVLNVKNNDDSFTTRILIDAKKTGNTKIFVVAPGFQPLEIPITVYGNKQNGEKLLVKTTPNTFSNTGPNYGFISVTLTDEDGFPVIAKKDIIISLTIPNREIVELPSKDLIIRKGNYFTIDKFTVKKAGTTKIFVYSDGMETAKSDIITVNQNKDLKVKLFVLPDTVNSFGALGGSLSGAGAQGGYIIGILQEGFSERRLSTINNDDEQDDDIEDLQKDGSCDEGESDDLDCNIAKPVIAKKDIRVNFKVTNSNFTQATNTSPGADLYGRLKVSGTFDIKKGQYWGYAPFVTRTGLEDTYDIVISSDEPLSVDSQKVKAVNVDLLDDKLIKFETLPILATGKRELIGIAHLEDENGNPINADRDLEINIHSSNDKYLQIEPAIIKHGTGSVLVFAKTSQSIPDKLEVFANVDKNDKLIQLDLFGPRESSIQFIVTPLVPKVLADTKFPLLAYYKDDEAVIKLPNPEIFISPSKYVEISPTENSLNDGFILLEGRAIKAGSDTVYFEANNYETNILIESLSSGPAVLKLDHSKTIYEGNNDILSLQILDSAGSPIFTHKDIEVTLIPEDSILIEVPQTIKIEKGNYFTLFDMAAKKSGDTNLTVLTDGIPPSTTDIKIINLKPSVEINAPELVQKDDAFDATLSVTYNKLPFADADVSWMVDGAIVQISDPKTNNEGKATISMIGVSDKSVNIEATVSSSVLSPAKVNKTVRINATNSEFVAFGDDGSENEIQKVEVFGFDPVIILVPVALGSIGFIMKKKGMLKIKN